MYWLWLIIYNSINTNIYLLIVVLEVLTILLIYNIKKWDGNILNYVIISGISSIFYIINYNKIFILLAFGLKLGLYPLNLWIINIYKRFNIELLLIWTLLPKIIFLLIFNKYYWLFTNNIFLLWNIVSIVLMSIYGLKLYKLNEILGLSSIINNSYLYLVLDKELFLIYYSIHIVLIGKYLNKNIRNLWYNNVINYIIFILCIISLIGIPPLIGFNIKYMILETYYNNILIIFTLIISSIYYISLIKYVSIGKNLINIKSNIGLLSVLLI